MPCRPARAPGRLGDDRRQALAFDRHGADLDRRHGGVVPEGPQADVAARLGVPEHRAVEAADLVAVGVEGRHGARPPSPAASAMVAASAGRMPKRSATQAAAAFRPGAIPASAAERMTNPLVAAMLRSIASKRTSRSAAPARAAFARRGHRSGGPDRLGRAADLSLDRPGVEVGRVVDDRVAELRVTWPATVGAELVQRCRRRCRGIRQPRQLREATAEQVCWSLPRRPLAGCRIADALGNSGALLNTRG